jgi:hypothetical protein
MIKIGWDEQSFSYSYKAHAEFTKDVVTGVIMIQSFEVIRGSATTATEFWGRYGGGLAATANFEVTAILH